MADVKWIKITTDIFDDEKLLMIEGLPLADSIITIWFKLLVLAGKQNNNGVFMMNDKIAYTDEMLATIFRRDLTTVRLALNTFEQFGMIETYEGVITIPNWNKHQSLDSYEKKKIRDAKYQSERRKQQKALIDTSKGKSSDNRLTSRLTESDESSGVAFSDIEKDIDIDKDIDKKEKDKKENPVSNKNLDTYLSILETIETNPIAEVDDVFRDWLEYKAQPGNQRLIYAERGLKGLIAEVEKQLKANGKEYVEEVIKVSMNRGWKGITWDAVKPSKNKSSDVDTEEFLKWIQEERK